MDRRKSKRDISRSSTAERKSTCLESNKNIGRSILSPVDFNSETLSSSSPIKPDIVIKTKTRRKKIRCTQDFNQLNNSLTSQDSHVYIKSNKKKTRKAKGMYDLPKINNLLEDRFVGNEEISSDIFMESNITRKKDSKGKYYMKSPKETNAVERSISRKTSKNGSIMKSVKKLKNKNSSRNNPTDDSEESQDINSAASENDEDCEIKVKRGRQMENFNGNHMITQVNNKPVDYEKRLRNILSDDCILTSDENSENAKCLKKRKSLRKLHRLSTNSRSTGNENFLQKDIGLICNSSDKSTTNENESENEVNQTGRYVRYRSPKEKVKRSNSRKSSNDLSNIRCNTAEGFNKRNSSSASSKFVLDLRDTKPSETKSNFSSIFCIDDGNMSDDVFNSTENKWPQEIVNRDGLYENNRRKEQIRKSVRFTDASVEPNNTRRSTFDVDKCRSSITLFNKKSVEIISNIADNINDDSKSELLSKNADPDSSFEATNTMLQENAYLSEKNSMCNNTYKHLPSVTQVINAEINRSNKTSLSSPISDSNINSANEIASIGRSSPKYLNNKRSESNISNDPQLFNQSIIDLTTPYNEKRAHTSSGKILRRDSTFTKNDTPNRENLNITFDNYCKLNNDSQHIEVLGKTALNSSLNKLSEQSTVVLTPRSENVLKNNVILEGGPLNTSLQAHCLKSQDNDLTGITPNDSYLGICNKSFTYLQTPKLDRTATFIKDDIKCNSPAANDLTTKGMDTSKVTKRKQWNKSRPSSSFLDGLVDIGDVSAPWTEDTLNDTFKISGDEVVLSNNLQSSTKRNEMYRAPPSSTSTPLPEFKNSVLQKVLSRDKNLTVSESKNVTKTECVRNVAKSENKQVGKTRTKMPNFALIHQRAYAKLESLKEMSERKAQRAKLLLSGCKPGSTTSLNSSSKSKKFLQFNPVKSTKIPKSIECGKKVLLNSSIISITKVKDVISPSRSNPNIIALNKLTPIDKKKQLLKAKTSKIPTKITNNIAPEKKAVTKYGFKAGPMVTNKIGKEEQLKAVATKTRVVKNTIEERRNVIQGVRSNRRFELLMGLRKK